MRSGGGAFMRGLVAEEIGRLVAEAVATGSKLSVAECAAKVRNRYPNFEITEEQLAEEITIAAAAAEGEIGPHKPSGGTPNEGGS